MENELFKSISQRSTIPGGTCSFDLPAFYFWLQSDDTQRKEDLDCWIRPFNLIRSAIDVILGLIRSSGTPKGESAKAGFFQKTLDHTLPYQLLRVSLGRSEPYFAEISGGKHRFTVRFMISDAVQRPVQCSRDVDFRLSCCLL
jgi:cell division protein ZapD